MFLCVEEFVQQKFIGAVAELAAVMRVAGSISAWQ